MADELHRFDYDPMVHRDPGCQWPRCGRPSDGSLDGEPWCFDHLERVIERWVAVSEFPDAARNLPALFDS